jgi:hypothetical protein
MSTPDLTYLPPEPTEGELVAKMLREAPEFENRRKVWFTKMSPLEKALQAAFLGAGALDWGQTIKFTQDPTYQELGHREMNPILGPHPSRTRVNVYMPLALAAHTLGVWALPRPYRNILQIGGLGLEGWAVHNNAKKGVSPTWPWK